MTAARPTFKAGSLAGAHLPLYINGQWISARGGVLKSFDPTTGQPWYEFGVADVRDVDNAVQAAASALASPEWRRITSVQRANLLRRLAELLRANTERLAQIDSIDNGKLLREMRAQLSVLPDQFHYFAGAADKLEGRTIPTNKLDVLAYTVREPIGVVAIITPWNSPLYQLAWTLAPAFACGNAVIAKPSEHTTASALALAELVEEAGFPRGVYNVVTGPGLPTGNALARHPGVAKIAFTGSTATGRRIAENAGTNLVQVNLELGGKSPNCVFADADLERAVNGVVAGIFAAGGQTCVAGSRILVQQSIYEDFVERLVDRTRHITIGLPSLEATQLGPIAVLDQLTKIEGFVSRASDQGARLLVGGKRPSGDLASGWYFEPTLFDKVDVSTSLAQEEVFGPVGAIMPFRDESELAQLANSTRYGLTAGIWTKDLDRAMRFARDVDVGMVWVNTYRAASFTTPMGGFKESGYGKHYGLESMHEYSRSKSVMVDYSGSTQDAFVMRVQG